LSTMGIDPQSIEAQIPYYLTEPQKVGFRKALKDFQEARNVDYFINQHADVALQGDGWPGLSLINFITGDKQPVKGIILSNSCDISVENRRDVPSMVVFAPLIRLSRFKQKLEQSGLSEERITEKLNSIRKQQVSSIFYLPPGGNLEFEYFAPLDDLHSMPLQVFIDTPDKQKLFTLSMFGFWFFLFKLSIHFCRFQEELARN